METKNKVALHIHVVVQPEFIEAFKKAANETAEEALKEDACILINSYHNPDNPGEFILYEEWADKDYLLSDTHQKSEHIVNFFSVTEPMIKEPFTYGIYDVLSESKGAFAKSSL